MSSGNDQGTPGNADDGPDLSNEIDRTMAEAEAAVEALSDDDDDGDEPAAESASPSAAAEEIERLKAEVAGVKDKWLRAVADLENYKKRVKREMEEQAVRTTQSLLPSFLPVMDNLERALEVAEPTVANASDENTKNVENLVQGLKMVAKEFLGALSRNGIEPVQSVGQAFDPSLHDALQQFDSPDHPPGVVIREFEKGYRMKERLLRPARVIVAGAGSTGKPIEEAEEG